MKKVVRRTAQIKADQRQLAEGKVVTRWAKFVGDGAAFVRIQAERTLSPSEAVRQSAVTALLNWSDIIETMSMELKDDVAHYNRELEVSLRAKLYERHIQRQIAQARRSRVPKTPKAKR